MGALDGQDCDQAKLRTSAAATGARPYARLAAVIGRQCGCLEAAPGFACLSAGEVHAVEFDGDEPFVRCSLGRHLIALAVLDDLDTLMGFYAADEGAR